MKIAIIKCRDCGTELNRTIPFEDGHEGRIRVTSGLAAGKCPNGCRETLMGLNLNTELVIHEAQHVVQEHKCYLFADMRCECGKWYPPEESRNDTSVGGKDGQD